jgi:alkylation response protein AidB-like acyl-CoA dehydrogenase
MVNADGTPGRAQRASTAAAIEHKMGIHGNATCQMMLDGAVGTLVGQPHKGLAAMFVMMNAARLGVGNQSLGLTEVAYQNAVAYAKDRMQMRSLSGPKAPDKPADSDHRAPGRAQDAADRPGLRRGRPCAGGATCALLIDQRARPATTKTSAKTCADLVALLTPIIKAFMTDNGWIATMPRACRSSAATATSGNGAWSSTCATPAST